MGICSSENESGNINPNNNTIIKNPGTLIKPVDPLNKYYKSICKIKFGNEQDIGFLLKLKIVQKKGQKEIYCLIINGYLINEKTIELKKDINVHFDFEKEERKINLGQKGRIVKHFIDLNITFIEILLNKDNINQDYFLEQYSGDTNFKYKKYNIAYYNSNNLNYQKVGIKNIKNNYIIEYNCDTNICINGSPILTDGDNQVIGIHKKEFNQGTLIHPINKFFEDKKSYDICKCMNFEKNDKYEYDDGSYYIGEWKNGLRHGKGKFYDNNLKIEYEGEWVNDKKEGLGKMTTKEGICCISKYNNDLPNENLEILDINGKTKFKGNYNFITNKGFGKMILEDDDYYIGEVRNLKKEGKGKIYDKNNNIIYDGEFVNNLFEGHGRYNHPGEGSYYIGEFKLGEVNGKGKKYNKDGLLLYDGEWANEKPHGIGTYIKYDINGHPNNYFVCEFKNGKKNGKGKVFDKNHNIIYDGYFINDMPQSKGNIKGKLVGSHGYIYEGDILNEKPDGEGKLYFENKLIYEGHFEKGVYEGFGKKYYDNDDYYIGEFKNGKTKGKGKVFDKNNNLIYEGDYSDDEPDGFGKFILNGQCYIGEFKKGKRNGRGIQYKNGEIFYEGEWVNDKPEGYGKSYIDNGGYYIGEFKDGDINGKGTMYDKNGNIIYSGTFDSKKILKMMNIPCD